MLLNLLMYASSPSELSLLFGHDDILVVSPECEEKKKRGKAESEYIWNETSPCNPRKFIWHQRWLSVLWEPALPQLNYHLSMKFCMLVAHSINAGVKFLFLRLSTIIYVMQKKKSWFGIGYPVGACGRRQWRRNCQRVLVLLPLKHKHNVHPYSSIDAELIAGSKICQT